tara:strand:+ start:110 stop:367 length:258 start_codon:yes stop_codon:yes gene_type:complete
MATFITTATKELSDITPPRVVVAEIPRSEETFIMPSNEKSYAPVNATRSIRESGIASDDNNQTNHKPEYQDFNTAFMQLDEKEII